MYANIYILYNMILYKYVYILYDSIIYYTILHDNDMLCNTVHHRICHSELCLPDTSRSLGSPRAATCTLERRRTIFCRTRVPKRQMKPMRETSLVSFYIVCNQPIQHPRTMYIYIYCNMLEVASDQ